jgi:hypothetical protein
LRNLELVKAEGLLETFAQLDLSVEERFQQFDIGYFQHSHECLFPLCQKCPEVVPFEDYAEEVFVVRDFVVLLGSVQVVAYEEVELSSIYHFSFEHELFLNDFNLPLEFTMQCCL